MENEYSERLCEEKHKNIKERLDSVDKRLDNHGERIDTIEKANIKLTEILERVTNPKRSSFWDSKVGQLIPWLIFTVIILVIAGLIGTDLIQTLKAIPTVK